MAVSDYGNNGGVEGDITKRQQWQTMVVADSIIWWWAMEWQTMPIVDDGGRLYDWWKMVVVDDARDRGTIAEQIINEQTMVVEDIGSRVADWHI